MATPEEIDRAVGMLAAADPAAVQAASDRLESTDPDIRHRVQAAVSFMAEPEQRPFWETVVEGYQ